MTPEQKRIYLANRRNRKHNRKKRSIKRLRALVSPQGIMAKKGADTMKRNAKKLVSRKGKRKGVTSFVKRHAEELKRRNDKEMKFKLERQVDGEFIPKPINRVAQRAMRESMWNAAQREKNLLEEAKRDQAIAQSELDMIRYPSKVREIDEEARTPEDLRMEGSAIAGKALINWGLSPTPDNIRAVSGEVSKQLVNEIMENKALAAAEVAQRTAQLDIAQNAIKEVDAEVPMYSEMAYDWGQLTI